MPIDEKIKRMQGLKIGMSSSGSSTDALIRSLFLARGYDPDKVVNLQPLGNGPGPARCWFFEKKLIDGVVWPSPVPEIIEYRGLGRTWPLIRSAAKCPNSTTCPISFWRPRGRSWKRSRS